MEELCCHTTAAEIANSCYSPLSPW